MLLYQVVNRGNGTVTPNADGDISLLSGWQGDVVPTATNQTIAVPDGEARGRLTDHRSGYRAFLQRRSRRRHTVADPPQLDGQRSAAYPPAALEQPDAALTLHDG